MKRKILLILSLPVLLFGCFEGNDNEEEPQPLADCAVTSSTWESPSLGLLPVQYIYNDKKQLTDINMVRDTLSQKSKFIYDDNGRITSIIKDDGYEYYQNEYNAKGQIGKVTGTRTYGTTRDTEIDTYTHSYNNAGQLVETILSEEDGRRSYRNIYHYTNGVNNHIEQTTYESPSAQHATLQDFYITYDGKKNILPESLLNQYAGQFRHFPVIDWAAGNVLSYRSVHKGYEQYSYTITNTYKYNAQGYPIEKVMSDGGNEIIKETYSYQCD